MTVTEYFPSLNLKGKKGIEKKNQGVKAMYKKLETYPRCTMSKIVSIAELLFYAKEFVNQ